MARLGALHPIALFFLTLCGCGDSANSNAVLQSITISPSSATGSTQFTATGTYGNGKQVTPLPVTWFLLLKGGDLDPAPGYSLTVNPYSGQCSGSGAYIVTAFAPQSQTAPNTGTMPANVWVDLVTGNTQNEGGFVGASAQLNCP